MAQPMELPKMVEEEVIPWLIRQDDLYENEGESEASDADYDRVKRQASILFSHNRYFLGVGAPVRGGKVKLPFAMNGLQQVYEGETLGWVNDCGAQKEMALETDKLDGVSSQILFAADGHLQISFSRGNGDEAADTTRHISRIPGVPKTIEATGKTVAIRAEVIMKKKDFVDHVQKKFFSRSGKPYKNARNATAGIMNSSEADPSLYQYLHVVAYTILDYEGTKLDQLLQLRKWGFEMVRYSPEVASELTDAKLISDLEKRKASSEYELDGLVIDINSEQGRKRATDLGKPVSVKYKVADEENLKTSTVRDVIYRASKDGYLKPRVQIDPVELCGVTVTFATAFNAKYVKDNKIGPGAEIKISRSGDTIPDIQSILTPAKEALLPDPEEWGEWEWSVNDKGEQVDAILSDSTGRRDVRIRKFVDVFTKLKVDQLKVGSCEKLFDAGFTTIESIIYAPQSALVAVLGENGNKVHESLSTRLDGIYWPEFVGSLGFMGRGVGRKRMTALYNAFEGNLEKMKDLDAICAVEGFQIKTATKVVDAIERVQAFIALLDRKVNLIGYTAKPKPTGDRMKGQAVVFTGIRSEALEKKIMEEGGEIKSGISKGIDFLVCKDPQSSSSKMVKARSMGIRIISIREMELILES